MGVKETARSNKKGFPARARRTVDRLAFTTWILLLATIGARAAEKFDSVYISELLVEGTAASEGVGQKQPGWIELYNGGPYAVNLAGWFLTDSTNNRTLWRFPEVTLLPAAYMVVAASGTSKTDDLAHLQTSFKLSRNGGYLALVSSSTNVVSVFAPYPKQTEDVSYGRLQGEPRMCCYFAHPTPGKPNETSGKGFAEEVKFSRASGTFLEPFKLELAGGSPSAIIRYTLNGQLPTGASPVYREPLEITNSSYIRARVYEGELLPGPPRSENYQLISASVAQFRPRLPVLIMDTSGTSQATSTRSSLVKLSFYEPDQGKTSVTNAPALSTRGGFHTRGSTSAQMEQPAFALQFVDEFNHEEHHAVLEMPANSDWVLYAPTSYDPIMIHNPFVHQLSRDMGRWSPRTRFVEVYMVRHGGPVTLKDYYGLYVMEEKIKVGKHRVAIDRLGPEDRQAPEVTGGYLLKFDRLGPGESGFWAGGTAMVYVEPKEPVITLPQRAPQQEYINSYIEEFNRALHSPEWKDPDKGYRAYIDVGSWIDFHVLEVLSGNVDALKFSTFFYKPRGGKLTYGPHWDFDRALGSPDQRDNFPNRWNTGRFFDAPWWGRLFRDPDFWQLWVDRWQELRRTLFSEANLSGLVDRLADEVREAQPREAKRWELEPRGGSYQSEVDWMKEWLSQRTRFIDEQLTRPPELSSQGGQVKPGFTLTLSGPPGATIYYTLDGSDPRLPQGGISSGAVEYSEPIALKSDVHLTARARDPNQKQTGGPHISTPWSCPVNADFRVVR